MSSDNKRRFEDEPDSGSEKTDKKKCRRRWGAKSRWGDSDMMEKETVLSGLPTVIPSGLTKEQEEMYLLQLQIEEITRRLQTGELGIPPIGERSPSPEPVYNHEGKRTNTREVRTKKKLETDRHKLVQKMIAINPQFRPPHDYKAPVIRFSERVFIPQDEHPEIGFIGMIIGPRGNSLRKVEKDTGCNIVIRGKGSVKEGRIGTKDGKPLPGADEPLHAYITADCEETVKKGVDRIRKIISDAINIPDEDNDWMREQLRELAVINGTLRESDTLTKLQHLRDTESIITNKILCHMCGGAGHIARDCKQRRPGESLREMANVQASGGGERGKKLDVEYMSLMAELGQGPAPAAHLLRNSSTGVRPQIHQQNSRPPLALPAPSQVQPLLGGSSSGVRPLLGFGGGNASGANGSFGGGAKPSLTDITAGAILLASIVQGLSTIGAAAAGLQQQPAQVPAVNSRLPNPLLPQAGMQNNNAQNTGITPLMQAGMQSNASRFTGGNSTQLGTFQQQNAQMPGGSGMPSSVQNAFQNQPQPPPWMNQLQQQPRNRPPWLQNSSQNSGGFQSRFGGPGGFMGGGGMDWPNYQ